MTLLRLLPRASFLALSALALVGCSGLRHTLGIDKQPPDEFAVVESPPLVMPPDFSLRPPASPSQKPADTPVEEQARETIFRLSGNSVQPVSNGESGPAGMSSGENAFLNAAGAGNSSPSIRDQIDQEALGVTKQNRSFADELLFWRTTPKPADESLDAAAEEKRLQANEAAGQPVTTGTTPMAVQRQRTFLESLF